MCVCPPLARESAAKLKIILDTIDPHYHYGPIAPPLEFYIALCQNGEEQTTQYIYVISVMVMWLGSVGGYLLRSFSWFYRCETLTAAVGGGQHSFLEVRIAYCPCATCCTEASVAFTLFECCDGCGMANGKTQLRIRSVGGVVGESMVK